MTAQVFGQKLRRLCADAPALVSSLKRHPALYRALRARFAGQKPSAKPSSFERIRRQLAELFSDAEFLGNVVAQANGSLPLAAVDETVRHTTAQLADSVTKQLSSITERLVESGDFGFEPGIDVTDLDQVKGLEFDYVLVPDATLAAYPATDDSRHRLHVAVTRAVAHLSLFSGGKPTPLLHGLLTW